MRTAVVVLVAAFLVLSLAGCGGGGSAPTVAKGRIHEFEGAGYAGEKPGGLEGIDPAAAVMKALPDLLALNAAPLSGTVPTKQMSWYRLAAYPTERKVVVTLQQLAPEDSDLYVLKSPPYTGDAQVLGKSTRTPTGGAGTDICDAGVPDWVFLTLPGPNEGPAAQLGVYGVNGGDSPKHYSLEIDTVTTVTISSETSVHGYAPRFSSRWYRFRPTIGVTYDVVATLAGGSDPDLFLYRGSSTGFISSDVSNTGAHVQFTATNDCWHYIRMYGYGNDTANHYDLRVLPAPG